MIPPPQTYWRAAGDDRFGCWLCKNASAPAVTPPKNRKDLKRPRQGDWLQSEINPLRGQHSMRSHSECGLRPCRFG